MPIATVSSSTATSTNTRPDSGMRIRPPTTTSYCPKGRDHFDPWPDPRYAPERKWSPSADHYPTLKKDGGKLKPWNVRLAHVHCNNMDFGWRTRIRWMLEKDPALSFEEIAETLNRKMDVQAPPPAKSWTAELVRKAYAS